MPLAWPAEESRWLLHKGTHFAAAERYLNRVWSASADGYIDEVNEYLQKAGDQFAESLATLRRFQESPAIA